MTHVPAAFPAALEAWRLAARTAAIARCEALRVEAEALGTAAGKTAELRRAVATLASHQESLSAELTAIEARALYHAVIHLRDAEHAHSGGKP